jgi:membrane-associated protease RseP (regulator of RpoE activity)
MNAKWVPGIVLLGVLVGAVSAEAQNPQLPPRATLGVMIEPPRPGAEKRAAVVQSLDPSGAAAKAGIKPGDVIVKIGDKEVGDFDGLVKALREHKPGEQLALHVKRDGNEQTLNVTLGERAARLFPEGFGQPGSRNPFEGMPGFGEDRQTIQRLERRVEELEKRVRELEKKQGPAGK